MILFDRIAALLPDAVRPVALQFAGYVAVSGVAFVVDFSIYCMLLRPLRIATAAAVAGYVAGVLVHYLLSSRVVFARQLRVRGVASEAPVLAQFFAAGGTGLAVTAVTVGVLADGLGVPPIAAKLVATCLSFVCVFSALRLFVFNTADVSKATA